MYILVQGHQRAASLVLSCMYAIVWTINIDTLTWKYENIKDKEIRSDAKMTRRRGKENIGGKATGRADKNERDVTCVYI